MFLSQSPFFGKLERVHTLGLTTKNDLKIVYFQHFMCDVLFQLKEDWGVHDEDSIVLSALWDCSNCAGLCWYVCNK